jgi:2-dehydro-3-deoxyphosphogluconate aldolase/(4S)-4-hydroxy-2-oxoglutarate aldolase
MKLIESFEKHKIMVAIRTDTPENAYEAAMACIAGGIKLLEITFTVPDADEVIQKISQRAKIPVGAGTILSIADARKAMKSGASYIVSPHFDEKIVKFAKKEGLVSIPGACTPTEIYRAYRAGGDIIKLFPFVEMGGLDFLRVIRGPLHFIRYMLCGGVNLDNIADYLKAQPACILVGSAIVKREHVKAGEWGAIRKISGQFVKAVEKELR